MGNATTRLLKRVRDSVSNFDEAVDAVFRKADKNGNGQIEHGEFEILCDELGNYLNDAISSCDSTYVHAPPPPPPTKGRLEDTGLGL